MFPGAQGIGENVVSCNLGMAGCGWEKSGEHFHRCALARTVRAEESDDLAFLDFKIDAIHSRVGTKFLCQFFHLNHEDVILNGLCRLGKKKGENQVTETRFFNGENSEKIRKCSKCRWAVLR